MCGNEKYTAAIRRCFFTKTPKFFSQEKSDSIALLHKKEDSLILYAKIDSHATILIPQILCDIAHMNVARFSRGSLKQK